MIRVISLLSVFVSVISSDKAFTFDVVGMSTPTAAPHIIETSDRNTTAVAIFFDADIYQTNLTSGISSDHDDSYTEDSEIRNSGDSAGNVDAVKGLALSSSSLGPTTFIVGAIDATTTIKSTYVNRVGTALDTSSATACYREAHIAKVCPLGFDSSLGTCWSQCPYSYPVECSLQCIRPNDDCALASVSKISVIAQSALSFATLGLYGDFKALRNGIQIECTRDIIGLVKSLAKYVGLPRFLTLRHLKPNCSQFSTSLTILF
ncbi:unnamed protein product [Phytophthora fragariaefolia]|uniref:Unnamed protein product n=1 Tax=Phytophthora fragariaefolia TaxID=1490495 RepID=A0A9W6X0A3_9STRA|nr:unnamed protein product [Phytophthora fragariaefolia]